MKSVVAICLLCSAAVQAVDLEALKNIYPDASLEQHAAILAALKANGEAGPGRGGGELALLLDEAGFPELQSTFEARGIIDTQAFLLLDFSKLANFFPGIELGTRLKLEDFIAQKRGHRQPGGAAQQDVRDYKAMATTLASLLETHERAQAGQDAHRQDVAAIVAEAIEKNNQVLLGKMNALIEKAQLAARPPFAGLEAPPRELQAESAAAPRALNTEGASLWLEDDDARLVLGANADTDLSRGGAGVLSTGGALQLGEGPDDLTCTAAATGTMRWFAQKKTLQVCEGTSEKWKAAGGAVLDAADEEPCTSETPGALQFDAHTKVLGLCDGAADAYRAVVVASAATGNVGAGVADPQAKLHVRHSNFELARFEGTHAATTWSLGVFGGSTASAATPAGALSLGALGASGGGVGGGTHYSKMRLDPEGRASFTGSVQVGFDAECSAAREGALRWNSEDQLLEVCNGEGEWGAVYEPPPPPPVSCAADYTRGNRISGLVTINPSGDGVTLAPVWCDHDTDGGGWTMVASVVTQDPMWTAASYTAANSARQKTLGSPDPGKNYVLKLPLWKTLLDTGNFGGGASKLRLTVKRLDNNAEVTLGVLVGMSMLEPSFSFTNPSSVIDGDGNSVTSGHINRCIIQYTSDMQGTVVNAAFDSSDNACTNSLGWNGGCGYTSLGHNGGYEGSGAGRFSHACSLCQGYYCASDHMSCKTGNNHMCYYNAKWYWIK